MTMMAMSLLVVARERRAARRRSVARVGVARLIVRFALVVRRPQLQRNKRDVVTLTPQRSAPSTRLFTTGSSIFQLDKTSVCLEPLLHELKRTHGEVVSQQLHDEGAVLVRIFIQRVQLRYRVIEGLQTHTESRVASNVQSSPVSAFQLARRHVTHWPCSIYRHPRGVTRTFFNPKISRESSGFLQPVGVVDLAALGKSWGASYI